MDSPNSAFCAKKARILAGLSRPADEYTDLSPKGSIDAPIRQLIETVNESAVMVTTSSCSGRLSVFLEGHKSGSSHPAREGDLGVADEIRNIGDASNSMATITASSRIALSTASSVGGKGTGGKWLFVSHDPVDRQSVVTEQLQPNEHTFWHDIFHLTPASNQAQPTNLLSRPIQSTSFVHLKFEPFILHVLVSSVAAAQLVLSCALQAGFRESGVVGLSSNADGSITPVVAVRSNGLAFESIIGLESDNQIHSLVTEQYLAGLVELANYRFIENSSRIVKFTNELKSKPALGLGAESEPTESKEERRRRKRQQGLARQSALQEQNQEAVDRQV